MKKENITFKNRLWVYFITEKYEHVEGNTYKKVKTAVSGQIISVTVDEDISIPNRYFISAHGYSRYLRAIDLFETESEAVAGISKKDRYDCRV